MAIDLTSIALTRQVDEDWEKRAAEGDGAFAIAVALQQVAIAIHRLGTGSTLTEGRGAIECLQYAIEGKLEALTDAMAGIGAALERDA